MNEDPAVAFDEQSDPFADTALEEKQPEQPTEEKKKRGRPPKLATVASDPEEKKELTASEGIALEKEKYEKQKAERKARPPQKVWTETIGNKVIKFTRTAEGHVYREFVSMVKKKGK